MMSELTMGQAIAKVKQARYELGQANQAYSDATESTARATDSAFKQARKDDGWNTLDVEIAVRAATAEAKAWESMKLRQFIQAQLDFDLAHYDMVEVSHREVIAAIREAKQ